MAGKRLAAAMATITIPVALTVQAVLATGDTPPATATPEPPARVGEIDPGFIVRADADIDPGFIVDFEDRSNDAGFIVISDGPITEPSPLAAPDSRHSARPHPRRAVAAFSGAQAKRAGPTFLLAPLAVCFRRCRRRSLCKPIANFRRWMSPTPAAND